MTQQTCNKDGCHKPLRARGLCSTHYNQTHVKDRHKPKTVACVVCGKNTTRTGGGGRKTGAVCSTQCRTWVRTGRCDLPADHWARWYGRTSEWVAPVVTPRFVSTRCQECDAPMMWDTHSTCKVMPLYCSATCASRTGKRARRARLRGATGTHTRAQFIVLVEQSDGRCTYCDTTVAGIPDADHVTPISRGGSNDITNITPACRPCNADKNDLTLGEWAESRDERGLEPRRYELPLTDARFTHLIPSEATGSAWRHALAA